MSDKRFVLFTASYNNGVSASMELDEEGVNRLLKYRYADDASKDIALDFMDDGDVGSWCRIRIWHFGRPKGYGGVLSRVS